MRQRKYRYLAVALMARAAVAQATLPGTAPLTADGDFAAQMVSGIGDYLAKQSAQSPAERARYWHRDFSSPEAYARSIEPNRGHLAKIIGAVDPTLPVKALEFESSTTTPALIGRGRGYKIEAVRWPVWTGVFAEGLLLEPDRPPVARVVALPDADQSPEALAGLTAEIPAAAEFARRLAESGCQVLVPVIIDRQDTWSGIPSVGKMTNQPHREWIYRMAFEVGRQIVGYEVQKVRAAVDWFATENAEHSVPIAVAGYGEGGLLAFYSAALDTRIDATLVSGYFQPREQLWKEPIYRDLWGLLREFGDAEIAGMVAPRGLVVEASRVPQVTGPPKQTQGRSGAAPNGALVTPPLAEVSAEVERARPFFQGLHAAGKLQMIASEGGSGLFGSDDALSALFTAAGVKAKLAAAAGPPQNLRSGFDPSVRMHRQVDQLVGREGINQNLARFEKLKRVLLVADEFTTDNGILTPTLKLRRRVIEERYRHQIDELYAQAEVAWEFL